MGEDWSVPAWAVVASAVALLLLAVVLALLVVRSQRRAVARVEAALAGARADADALRAHVDAVERRLAPPATPATAEYKITMLGEAAEAEPAADGAGVPAVPVVDAPLFADLVLRESVVQAASLAAGLRRALAPETRNRIRFEMRREVKRARKQRRADTRRARLELEARRRAGIDLDGSAA